MLFVKENESALLNTLGPGPAEYETHSRAVDKARFGSKNKFTIPKVSNEFLIFVINFLFSLELAKHITESCFEAIIRPKEDTNFILRSSDSTKSDEKTREQADNWKL